MLLYWWHYGELNNQEVRKTKSILRELIAIKRELQAIRNLIESSLKNNVDGHKIAKAVKTAVCDTPQANLITRRDRKRNDL